MVFNIEHQSCAQCGNYGDYSHTFFDKNSVKVTDSLKKLLKSWFDEIFFGGSKFFISPHCGRSTTNYFYGISVSLREFYVE